MNIVTQDDTDTKSAWSRLNQFGSSGIQRDFTVCRGDPCGRPEAGGYKSRPCNAKPRIFPRSRQFLLQREAQWRTGEETPDFASFEYELHERLMALERELF